MIDFLERKRHLIIFLCVILSVGTYLLFSKYAYGLGLPLDDAWIYQTYARNLVHYGYWVYDGGYRTGGATGPLWVVVVAFGYITRLDPLFWAFLVGGVLLFAIGEIVMRILDYYFSKDRIVGLLGSLIVIFEWHNAWAAVSGMETVFLVFLILVCFYLLIPKKKQVSKWFFVGSIIGLSAWVRPDGLTLLGPALFLSVFQARDLKTRVKGFFNFLIGFGFLFILYLLFNFKTANTFWPNTFYAKQAEYSILRDLPYLQRLLSQFLIPITGVGALLLPGFVIISWRGIIEKKWEIVAFLLWCLVFLGIYAYRLPVTYQHGRYALPMVTIYILFGYIGIITWFKLSKSKRSELFIKVWELSVVVIIVVFWLLGANAYSKDVAAIETEMVATSQWIRDNTPESAIIAAHDIGAIGYFSDRKLVDLAGLVSPEVIPIIRDESALATYLDKKHIDFLVTFPGWYPDLIKDAEMIYTTNGPFSSRFGGENMAVYLWGAPKRFNPY